MQGPYNAKLGVIQSNPEYGQESSGGLIQGCEIPRDGGPGGAVSRRLWSALYGWARAGWCSRMVYVGSPRQKYQELQDSFCTQIQLLEYQTVQYIQLFYSTTSYTVQNGRGLGFNELKFNRIKHRITYHIKNNSTIYLYYNIPIN